MVFSAAGLKCRSQVTGYRPQVRSQVRLQATGYRSGHRSHKKTIGHWTKLFWTDIFVKIWYEREPGTVTNLLNDSNWHSLEMTRKIA